jgi:predicted methyltransferase
MMRKLTLLLALVTCCGPALAGDLSVNASVERAMFGEHRSEANIERNRFRHPVGTLEFFGLKADMTVLEIWPGAGWYTELLAPVLRDKGRLVVATWDPDVEGQPTYRYELPLQMQAMFEAHPGVYDKVETVHYSPPESDSLGEADSYDMILTFRNTHGWVSGGLAEAIFTEFARVLKPGGALGVVQHRAATGSDPAETAQQGYVSEEAVIDYAEAAGLVFEASSEVNANPRDTKDYPDGVWTLPPGYRLGDEDRERYTAIGESDRMTLRFRKPD